MSTLLECKHTQWHQWIRAARVQFLEKRHFYKFAIRGWPAGPDLPRGSIVGKVKRCTCNEINHNIKSAFRTATISRLVYLAYQWHFPLYASLKLTSFHNTFNSLHRKTTQKSPFFLAEVIITSKEINLGTDTTEYFMCPSLLVIERLSSSFLMEPDMPLKCTLWSADDGMTTTHSVWWLSMAWKSSFSSSDVRTPSEK